MYGILHKKFTGHGFIRYDKGRSIFFSAGSVTDLCGFERLPENAWLQFEIDNDPDGRSRAYNVRQVDLSREEREKLLLATQKRSQRRLNMREKANSFQTRTKEHNAMKS